jgi:hypothetical protein
MRAALTVCLFLACSFLQAQIQRIEAKRGEIVVITSTSNATVKWTVFQPVDLVYRELFDASGKSVLVFTPPPNARQAAIEELKIDWDAKTLESTRWVVTWDSSPEPNPIPPDPDDPDNPDPNPNPPDVPDGYLGLTKAIAAVNIPSAFKQHAKPLAAMMANLGIGLAPGDPQAKKYATVAEAVKAMKAAVPRELTTQESWSAWGKVFDIFNQTVEKNWPLTTYQMADAFAAAAEGIKAIR